MFSRTNRFLGLPLGRSVISALLPVGAVFLLAILLIGVIWNESEYTQFDEDNQRFADEYILSQKEMLRSEVNRIKNYLISEKKLAEQNLEYLLKERVNEGHAIARGLYNRYRDSHSDAEIQQMIISALREVRYNDGRGYYFITALDGTELLYPPNPDVEGGQVDEVFPPQSANITRDMRALVQAQSEGFLHYNWPRPDEPGQFVKKYSYVKLFEPYRFVIGTGDYLDDYEAQIRDRIFKQVADIRFGLNNEGYFFINSYEGDLFVTNGEYFAGRKNILHVVDAKGTKVVEENIRIAREKPEGAFTTYFWAKPGLDSAEKVSFILGVDEWQVFIGAGAYLDTIQQRLNERSEQYKSTVQKRNIGSFVVLLIAIVIVVVVLYVIGWRLSQNLEMFQNNLERSVDTWTKLEIKEIHFNEFKKLATSVNSMIDGLNMQAEELKYRAYHDHLTSLPNRMYGSTQLDLMISHTIKHQSMAALLFIDLDHFKEINDTLGHSAGDELLQQVSRRLRASVREDDIVARLGGDEFTVITSMLQEHNDAALIARKLLLELQEPYRIEGHELHITASIGIAVFPDDGDTSEILLRNADSAMYEAKRSGRNSFRYYTAAMTAEVTERFTLNDEIREAIYQKQFELFYQPQINLDTGEVVGAEALIRWNHPEKGLLTPDKFIPFAEDNGQIVKIGAWVLEEACSKIVEWRNLGVELPKVSVNISNQQMSSQLIDQVKQVLQKTGCPPEALELEITETSLMENPDQMSIELNKLKQLGVSLAIDDFGTGYSSLSYLKRLPINKLKVDRSFIRDLNTDENDRAITNAILAMGQSLNLTVIAEGVEHEAQLKFLYEHNCAEVQGYFFSKPLPEARLLSYMSAEREIEA